MRVSFNMTCLAAVLLAAGQAQGQQLFYNWISTAPEDNWNDLANWEGNTLNFVPDTSLGPGESARISNGNTAVVDQAVPTIAELSVVNGMVAIRQNGNLQTVVSGTGTGAFSTAAAGTIDLTGNGQLNAAGNGSNLGTLSLTGPDADVHVAGDFTTEFGAIGANITSASSHGLINVAGAATVGGTVRVNLSGFTPTYGQSWNVVTGGSLTGEFENVIVESSPQLARGLQIRGGTSGNSATVEVTNTLVLTLDRQSGATTIANVVGDPITITSYAIRSTNGLLSQSNWTQLSASNLAGPGWVNANPSNNNLAELNLEDSHSILLNLSLGLGSAYGGSTAIPAQEDVVFEYSTLDGEFRQGIVEYLGSPNDLVLYVDPANGAAAIGNLSPHFSAPTLTGYAIRSAEGQLTEGTWDSFSQTGAAGAGWAEANPSDELLSETNLENSKQFSFGTLLALGEIFTVNGERDLMFQYATLGGQVLPGSIVYGALPVPPGAVPGDYNGDGSVNAADYTVWRNTRNATVPSGTGADGTGDGTVNTADYNFWRANFGSTAGSGSGASSTNVPEPSSFVLAAFGLLVAAACQRSRRI